MMFALLEHDTRNCDPAVAQPGVHWDLLIELPTHERLPTWRLATDPTQTTAPVAAQRIQDHRRLYLDFEGEVSGGRGWVRRLDRGAARINSDDADRLTIYFTGDLLRGDYLLETSPSGSAVLRRLNAADRPD